VKETASIPVVLGFCLPMALIGAAAASNTVVANDVPIHTVGVVVPGEATAPTLLAPSNGATLDTLNPLFRCRVRRECGLVGSVPSAGRWRMALSEQLGARHDVPLARRIGVRRNTGDLVSGVAFHHRLRGNHPLRARTGGAGQQRGHDGTTRDATVGGCQSGRGVRGLLDQDRIRCVLCIDKQHAVYDRHAG